MELPYSSELPIHSFSRLFDNMSESYKLFWFQAVIEHVIQGKNRITFSEIIDYMIADAWYMVSEYRLNFGPSDTLEKLVFQIYENSGLKTTEKKENILKYLQDNQEPRAGVPVWPVFIRRLIKRIRSRRRSALWPGYISGRIISTAALTGSPPA